LTTSNFFDVLGVQPAVGRGFQPGEDQPGRERVAILSDRLWKRMFGADPSLVGREIRFDEQSFTVIGIMPASFDFPIANEVWTPQAFSPATRTQRANRMLVAFGRLKPGVTARQADADVARTGVRLQQAYPQTNKTRQFTVWPTIDFLVEGPTRQYLTMLLG